MNRLRRPAIFTLTVTVLTAVVIGAPVKPTAEAPWGGFMATADAAPRSGDDAGTTVWGTIKRYTDSHVIVDEKPYKLARNVLIDTYSLKKDPRGNVRLVLDANGHVARMFFYGIDMPDVVRRFKM